MRSLSLLLALLLFGCASGTDTPEPPPPLTDGYPPDFTLTLLCDTAGERWLYLIEPDRTLRAASGEGVGLDTYPPRTAKLTPRQMAEVYRLTQPFLSMPEHYRSGKAHLHDVYLTLEVPPDTDDPNLLALVRYLTTLRGGEAG